MPETACQLAWVIISIGVLVIVSLLAKALLERIRLPALLGSLLTGVGLRALDIWRPFLPDGSTDVLDLLAKIGIIARFFVAASLGMWIGTAPPASKVGARTTAALLSCAVAPPLMQLLVRR